MRRIFSAVLLPALCIVLATTSKAAPTPPSLAELDADTRAVAGAIILTTADGSQAQTLGIRVGDVVVSVNDEAVLDRAQFSLLLKKRDERKMTVVGSDENRRTVNLALGRIGIGHVTSPQRLTLATSRAMARDAAWNHAVIASAWALENHDPETAEQSLHAAKQAGYPNDAVMQGLTFLSHMANGHYAMASDMLDTMPPRTDAQHDLYLPGAAERSHLFLATGRCDELLGLVQSDPIHLGPIQNAPNWARDMALFRGINGPPTPLATEQDAPVQAVNPTLSEASRWIWGKSESRSYNREVIANKPFVMRAAPGAPAQAFLSRFDDFGDFDLHARFKASLSGRISGSYGASVAINVSDLRSPAPDVVSYFNGATSVLGASFNVSRDGRSVRKTMSGWAATQQISPSYFDGTREHHVHLSRRGDWGTIVVDGVTVLSRPVAPDSERLVFHLHVIGVKAEFSQFEITEPQAKP